MKIGKTKAQTLELLRKKKLKHAKICDSIIFTTKDWKLSKNKILANIKDHFKDREIIVRSSAQNEDTIYESMAGAYDSVKNIIPDNEIQLTNGIDRVVKSYGKDNNEKNEILIQNMVKDVSMSGVVFTYELNSGSPYFVINYDDVSGLTDTVTSGGGEYSNRTLYVYRKSIKSVKSNRFKKLLSAIKEVEDLMNSEYLDIEFALNDSLSVYILQVRAITTQSNWDRSISKKIDITLKGIENFLETKLKPLDGIFGDTTVYGQMPDWNPAEMIGRAPHRLASSLYSKLITNESWNVARQIMGYTTPLNQPLMVFLGGQPFIDTRLSFHSFLPKGISKELGIKIVNSCLNKLKLHPELHDKIEFDIAITTYSFDIEKKIKTLLGNSISGQDKKTLKILFRDLTLSLIDNKSKGSIDQSMEKIKILYIRQKNRKKHSGIDQLKGLINECIEYGTIPFSILARHGFIAKTLMLSLVDRKLLSKDEVDKIFMSIRTIASDLVSDMKKLGEGTLTRDKFMQKYGHLRPGTYDIMSARYDQMLKLGEDGFLLNDLIEEKVVKLTKVREERINKVLFDEGFKINFKGLLKYVEKATSGREFGKFVFTKTVSDILELIADFGKRHSLSREELSHISIDDFLFLMNNSLNSSAKKHLQEISRKNKKINSVSSALRLPQILSDKNGVYVVPFQVSQPNFITNKKIIADSVLLTTKENNLELNKKIILIENADPGFDWIFSKQIVGLVTKYGGANSHMAIRCAEFNIPAAIGCGEQRFNLLKNVNMIMIDCSNSIIKRYK